MSVADVLPDLVAGDERGAPQTVRYHFLPALLLAEIQRLKRERETQATELDALERQLAAQARDMIELRALVGAPR